jgi:predicted GTPase
MKAENPDSNALLNVLEQASDAIVQALGADSPLCARLSALRDRLKQERLQIAVLGQFKRGKSTFINALLGAPILPTDVVPSTAVATFIAWREKPLIAVQFAERGHRESFAETRIEGIREILSRFVTEDENPRNRLGVDRVEAFYPAPILAGGTVLIDTPGIGSTLTHNTEAALRLLSECDATIFVVSADPPITEVELRFLNRLKSKTGRIFFVLNKVDYLTPGDLRTVMDFLRKVLIENSLIEVETQIFAISARLGLSANQDRQAWNQSGMAAIEDHLVRYLAIEKRRSLDVAIRRQAAGGLSQAQYEVELRAKTLKMPIEKLEQKLSEFSQTLRSIEAQRLTIGDMLSGDRRRLIDELESRVRALREDATSRLKWIINDGSPDMVNSWEDRVKSAAPAVIEDFFSIAKQRFVDTFSGQVENILSNHRGRVDALGGDLRRNAAELFDVTVTPEVEGESFRVIQDPYWVTEQVVSTFIPDLNRVIDRLLPAAFGKRRRRMRLITGVNDMIVRNAENLRWAILRGLDETFRAATTRLEERLEETMKVTTSIIEDALAQRRQHSLKMKNEQDRLDRSGAALTAARAAVIG